jgi:hypothetical protein
LKDITMSSLKYRSASPLAPQHPLTDAVRRLAAAGLRSVSVMLARLSRRLARPGARVRHIAARLEFYAEAGAPEGALYLEGKLVGWVRGVRRL